MVTSDAMRLAPTVTQLKPAQLGQRVRLRGQRAVLNTVPVSRRWLLAGPSPKTGTGWPARYKPIDASLWRGWTGQDQLRDGVLTLLGETRALTPDQGGDPENRWAAASWDVPDAPLLWRFHLYYWDWAWALAGQRARPPPPPPPSSPPRGVGPPGGRGPRPGPCSPPSGGPGTRRSHRAAGRPGCPTRWPCGPGRSVAFTTPWSRGARSSRPSGPSWRPRPVFCAATWKPTSAATT